jgi:hypothetical protein
MWRFLYSSKLFIIFEFHQIKSFETAFHFLPSQKELTRLIIQTLFFVYITNIFESIGLVYWFLSCFFMDGQSSAVGFEGLFEFFFFSYYIPML